MEGLMRFLFPPHTTHLSHSASVFLIWIFLSAPLASRSGLVLFFKFAGVGLGRQNANHRCLKPNAYCTTSHCSWQYRAVSVCMPGLLRWLGQACGLLKSRLVQFPFREIVTCGFLGFFWGGRGMFFCCCFFTATIHKLSDKCVTCRQS